MKYPSMANLCDRNEDQYDDFIVAIKESFSEKVNRGTNVFNVDTSKVDSIYDLFLDNISDEARQHYVCRSCKRFVENFGGLVNIDENGFVSSLVWDENIVPDFFKAAVKELREFIESCKVKEVFVSSNRVLGEPLTNGWTHMNVSLPVSIVSSHRLKSSSQQMAEKREDFGMLVRALDNFNYNTAQKVVELLESGVMYRSEICLPIAKWFKELHEDCKRAKKYDTVDNVIWYAVATAPNGFTHINSSMIGTLLEDIQSGYDMDYVKRSYEEKVSSANYMRSTVAPSSGNVLQAERIVEKLGVADSLKRRYAKYDEVPTIWEGRNTKVEAKQSKSASVFENVQTKKKAEKVDTSSILPSSVLTWEKFKKTVLPTADKIEAMVDNSNRFMAIVTSAVEGSENILNWSNPFSWYYHSGIDGEAKRRVEEHGGRYEDNDIRATLVWNNYTDLDIHCINPSGREIYYGNKNDQHGGYLDIDMNAGGRNTCEPVENIRWAKNAPEGRYVFFVHNYAERGDGATPYYVELCVHGKTYTYNGLPLKNNNIKDVFVLYYRKDGSSTVEINGHELVGENNWNVSVNKFVEVKGITVSPNLWNDTNDKNGSHTFFLLKDCKDLTEGKGRGFFNEMLKSEFHEVRKTLESYCANTAIEGIEEDDLACGLGFSKDSTWNLTLRVTSNSGATRIVKIDRFD